MICCKAMNHESPDPEYTQPKHKRGQMTKNTIILFDLDGTLIDSTEAILESFRVSYDSFGEIVPDDDKIKSMIGLPLDTMYSELGVPQNEIESYIDTYRAHYRSIHIDKTTLLPGALEAIERAYDHAHLGVVTTKTGYYSRELLEHWGIMKYFGVLIGKEDVDHPKPHPEPIKKAVDALPEVAGSIYMVGDTCMDMEAARAAEAIGMGVLCGYGTIEKLKTCTSRISKSASEAVNTILKEIKN